MIPFSTIRTDSAFALHRRTWASTIGTVTDRGTRVRAYLFYVDCMTRPAAARFPSR
jgi:hypothetical protein